MMFFRIFAKNRSGWWRFKTSVTLGEFPDSLNFRLPCWLQVGMQKKITITEVDGMPDTVKQVAGRNGFTITLSTHFGDYDPAQLSADLPIIAKDSLSDFAAFVASHDGPVKILDEENILSSLGIAYIVIQGFNVDPDPAKPGILNVSLSCLSELMPDTSALEILSMEEPS